MSKIAVILFNLGSPSSKEAIAPFLMNFFMDKNIINLPLPFRYLLAKRISKKRSKCEAGNSYSKLNYKSPLLENTKAQANALEKALNAKNNGNNEYKTFISMRYWHPFALETAKEVQNYNPDKVILLPLYPQFSTTTTFSSFQNWDKALKKLNYNPKTEKIDSYQCDNGFIKASVNNIIDKYKQAKNDGNENIRILFSAHGLPEKIIKAGDPYQNQCEQSAREIVKELSDKIKASDCESLQVQCEEPIDWQICYQSRVGRLKWITPSIKQALDKAAVDKVTVIIYPHSFTQEHIETLVELDIEYIKYAKDIGVQGYYRANAVGIDKEFIDGLANLVTMEK